MKTIDIALLEQFLARKKYDPLAVVAILSYARLVERNNQACIIAVINWFVAFPVGLFLLTYRVRRLWELLATLFALLCLSGAFVPVLIAERRLCRLRSCNVLLAVELSAFETMREMFINYYGVESFGKRNNVRERFQLVAQSSLPLMTRTASVKSWRELPDKDLSSLRLMHSTGNAFVELEGFDYLLDSLKVNR